MVQRSTKIQAFTIFLPCHPWYYLHPKAAFPPDHIWLPEVLLCSYLAGEGLAFLFWQVSSHILLAQTGRWGLRIAGRVSGKGDGVVLIPSFSAYCVTGTVFSTGDKGENKRQSCLPSWSFHSGEEMISNYAVSWYVLVWSIKQRREQEML